MARVHACLSITVAGLVFFSCQSFVERTAGRDLPKVPWLETPFDKAVKELRSEGKDLLYAGAASAVITPKRKGSYMAGFGPNRRSTGMLDPVQAKVLYLNKKGKAAVIVTVDSAGVNNAWVWRLRHRLSMNPDMPLAVVATHDHDGPDLMGLWGYWALYLLPVETGADPDYLEWVSVKIERALARAVHDAKPVRVIAAEGQAPARGLCFNEHDPENWDRTVGVVKLEDFDGNAVATIVNFGCHPETLWQGNTLLSADYPGRLRARIEDRLGGTALFLPGALGAMVTPDIPRDAALEDRIEFMRQLGEDVADIALDALEKHGDPTGGTDVFYSRQVLSLPLNLPAARFLLGTGVIDRPTVGDSILTEVNLLELGGTQFIMAPAELPPEVGREIKDRMTLEHRYVVSTTNDELGYVLNLKQCLDPGYSYEQGARVSADLYTGVMEATRKLLAGR